MDASMVEPTCAYCSNVTIYRWGEDKSFTSYACNDGRIVTRSNPVTGEKSYVPIFLVRKHQCKGEWFELYKAPSNVVVDRHPILKMLGFSKQKIVPGVDSRVRHYPPPDH